MIYEITNSTQVKRIEIEIPDLRYIDYFIKLNCVIDLLKLKLFPNAKEITETVAIWKAMKQVEVPDEPNTFALVAGDGRTPRTAGFIAFISRHITAYSIDPELEIKPEYGQIRRLYLIKTKAEECNYGFVKAGSFVCFIFPHSHAPVPEVLKKFFETSPVEKVLVIDMPCCFDYKICEPEMEYEDFGVWSKKRRIKIFSVNKKLFS